MTNLIPQLTPGANLTVEGVPPISTILADTLRRYTESRAALLADWHPTRRELLSYTSVVLVFVLIMVLVVSAFDFAFSQAVLAVFGGEPAAA